MKYDRKGRECARRKASCYFISFAVCPCAALAIVLSLGALTTAAFATDHPPVSNASTCHSCHADMTRGVSVHSAMEAPCTTCHFVQTENAKTTFVLAMPKEQICFACHDKATILQQHTPEVRKNQTCVECHDSHSSGYPMLLLASADAEYRAKQPKKRPLRSGKLPANHASATLAKSPGKN